MELEWFNVLVGVVFAGSVWFAFECGRTDCEKNGCFRGSNKK